MSTISSMSSANSRNNTKSMRSTSSAEASLSGLTKTERIAALRAKMRRWGAATDSAPVSVAAATVPTESAVLPVPASMQVAFTATGMPGGLPSGGVCIIDRPGLVQAALIAEITRQHKHVAIINEPELSLATVAELGGDLARIAVVPDAGDNPLDIAAVLSEGVDLVTGRLPQATMTRARPLDSRLRSHNTALLLVDGNWPSTQLQIRSELASIAGLGIGHGRIRQLHWNVHLRAKSGLQAHISWSPGQLHQSSQEHRAQWAHPPLQLAR